MEKTNTRQLKNKDKQTDKQKYGQTNKQIDGQTNICRDRLTNRLSKKQNWEQTDKNANINLESRQTNLWTDRYTEDMKTKIWRDMQTQAIEKIGTDNEKLG